MAEERLVVVERLEVTQLRAIDGGVGGGLDARWGQG